MRNSVRTNHQLALLLLLAAAFLLGACVKLPRHTRLTSNQMTHEIARREAGRAAVAPVNINTASADELARLPGIGKGLAERIVSYRKEQGRFRRAEHLIMVPGISERRFRAMRALITVE